MLSKNIKQDRTSHRAFSRQVKRTSDLRLLNNRRPPLKTIVMRTNSKTSITRQPAMRPITIAKRCGRTLLRATINYRITHLALNNLSKPINLLRRNKCPINRILSKLFLSTRINNNSSRNSRNLKTVVVQNLPLISQRKRSFDSSSRNRNSRQSVCQFTVGWLIRVKMQVTCSPRFRLLISKATPVLSQAVRETWVRAHEQ